VSVRHASLSWPPGAVSAAGGAKAAVSVLG